MIKLIEYQLATSLNPTSHIRGMQSRYLIFNGDADWKLASYIYLDGTKYNEPTTYTDYGKYICVERQHRKLSNFESYVMPVEDLSDSLREIYLKFRLCDYTQFDSTISDPFDLKEILMHADSIGAVTIDK